MSALIFTIVLGILVLYLGFVKNKSILSPVAVAGLVVSIILSVKDWGLGSKYFHDMIIFDNFSIAFNVSMLIVTILIFLFGIDYYKRMEHHVAELYALMIFALTGAFLMTSYSNLIMLFLGIEILSIPLYVLAGGKKASYRSNEASFKYFMMGSFATTIFLFGIALVYGASATFYLPEIKTYIAQFNGHLPPMLMVGLLFILIGVAFKIAAAPFHFWSPDVYEGAPTLVTAYMATVVKTAGFAAFYRLLGMGLLPLPVPLEKALWVMTGLTLLIGNLGALRQTNFKTITGLFSHFAYRIPDAGHAFAAQFVGFGFTVLYLRLLVGHHSIVHHIYSCQTGSRWVGRAFYLPRSLQRKTMDCYSGYCSTDVAGGNTANLWIYGEISGVCAVDQPGDFTDFYFCHCDGHHRGILLLLCDP